MNNDSMLSYASIIRDRDMFRKSGTTSGGEFNYADMPGHKYFKILFYFDNGDADGLTANGSSGGLLAPTWNLNVQQNELYQYNSAWSYLKMNADDKRADMLESFVNLLSNINSESPWYFSEISGIDSALERSQVKDFKFEEERKKISIKCLPDAFDDRIGTLLDLYRAIVWSWTMKREVVPANLRKFDMGIFIFETPTTPFHKSQPFTGVESYEYASIGDAQSDYKTSYKYIEFHNCEIDYNSAKSSLGTLTNKEGVEMEYTIDISFDDCYETRYNEFLMKTLGDMIEDSIPSGNIIDEMSTDFDTSMYELKLNEFMDYYQDQDHQPPTNMKLVENKKKAEGPGIMGKLAKGVETAAKELIGSQVEWAKSKLKRAVLGNIYTYSLATIGQQAKGLLSGHVFSTANAIQNYKEDNKKAQVKYVSKIGNIYKDQTIANNI